MAATISLNLTVTATTRQVEKARPRRQRGVWGAYCAEGAVDCERDTAAVPPRRNLSLALVALVTSGLPIDATLTAMARPAVAAGERMGACKTRTTRLMAWEAATVARQRAAC